MEEQNKEIQYDGIPKVKNLWDRVWPGDVTDDLKDKAWGLLPENFRNRSDIQTAWEEMWIDYTNFDDCDKFPSFIVQTGSGQDFLVYLDGTLGVEESKVGWHSLSVAQYFFFYGEFPDKPCFHLCGNADCTNPIHLWNSKDGNPPPPKYPYDTTDDITLQ